MFEFIGKSLVFSLTVQLLVLLSTPAVAKLQCASFFHHEAEVRKAYLDHSKETEGLFARNAMARADLLRMTHNLTDILLSSSKSSESLNAINGLLKGDKSYLSKINLPMSYLELLQELSPTSRGLLITLFEKYHANPKASTLQSVSTAVREIIQLSKSSRVNTKFKETNEFTNQLLTEYSKLFRVSKTAEEVVNLDGTLNIKRLSTIMVPDTTESVTSSKFWKPHRVPLKEISEIKFVSEGHDRANLQTRFSISHSSKGVVEINAEERMQQKDFWLPHSLLQRVDRVRYSGQLIVDLKGEVKAVDLMSGHYMLEYIKDLEVYINDHTREASEASFDFIKDLLKGYHRKAIIESLGQTGLNIRHSLEISLTGLEENQIKLTDYRTAEVIPNKNHIRLDVGFNKHSLISDSEFKFMIKTMVDSFDNKTKSIVFNTKDLKDNAVLQDVFVLYNRHNPDLSDSVAKKATALFSVWVEFKGRLHPMLPSFMKEVRSALLKESTLSATDRIKIYGLLKLAIFRHSLKK